MKLAVASPFLGAYWKARKESRTECATRISNYLSAISSFDPAIRSWYQKAFRRQDATTSADLSIVGIDSLLKANKRDVSGDVIVELGFNLSLWNGGNASFSATVGSFSPYVENSVVISFRGESPVDAGTWRQLIETAVQAFDPDSAVVTNHDYIAAHGGGSPDEAGGWFTYMRGAPISESPFP